MSITQTNRTWNILYNRNNRSIPFIKQIQTLSRKAAKQKFKYMMQQGLPRALRPLHHMQKKNSNWRPCEDYRKLNEVVRLLNFLQDSTHFLHGKTVFSMVDLRRAYQQISVLRIRYS